MHRSHLLVGSGSSILVADPDESGSLQVIGSGLALQSPPVGSAELGELLLVADRGGLHVVDLGDPEHPAELGFTAVDSPVLGMAAGDAVAYLVGWETLHVIDLSSPVGPRPVEKAQIAVNAAVGVAAADRYVYLAEVNRFRVLDATVPEQPVELGSISLHRVDDLKVMGQHVYLTDRSRDTVVIDVSNPSSPTVVAELEPARALWLDGDRLLATTSSVLRVYDVSDPGSPTLTSTASVGRGVGVAVLDGLVFVADEMLPGVRSFAGDGWAEPVEVAIHELPGPAVAVEVSPTGRFAFVAAGGLVVLDLENPESPVQVASWRSGADLYDLALSGSTLVVSDWVGGIRVVDVSSPTGPLPVAGGLAPFALEPVVAADGSLAFASDRESLRIFDISVASEPVELGRLELDWSLSLELTASENLVYISDDHGLRIVDASDPAQPFEVGAAPLGGQAGGIAVAGGLAYLTYSQSSADRWGLAVFDVTTPEVPVEIGRCSLPAFVSRVSVVGDLAYLTGAGSAITVVDVSDPSSPTLCGQGGRLGADSYGNDVAVAGPGAVVTLGELGVSVLEPGPCLPRHPTGRVATGLDVARASAQ